MKKIKCRNKISLSKETIVKLSDSQISHVKGGHGLIYANVGGVKPTGTNNTSECTKP